MLCQKICQSFPRGGQTEEIVVAVDDAVGERVDLHQTRREGVDDKFVFGYAEWYVATGIGIGVALIL